MIRTILLAAGLVVGLRWHRASPRRPVLDGIAALPGAVEDVRIGGTWEKRRQERRLPHRHRPRPAATRSPPACSCSGSPTGRRRRHGREHHRDQGTRRPQGRRRRFHLRNPTRTACRSTSRRSTRTAAPTRTTNCFVTSPTEYRFGPATQLSLALPPPLPIAAPRPIYRNAQSFIDIDSRRVPMFRADSSSTAAIDERPSRPRPTGAAGFNIRMSFPRPWTEPESPRRRRGERLHGADADPGAGDPARARAPRRPRHRPDRHRQDRLLRAADADAPRKGPRPGPHAAHADPRADARARRAGRGEFQQIRQEPQAERGAADRRRLVRRPGQEARPRRRRADRHARPPARPFRARQAPADRRRDPRHRRGRPHARHGLHPRHRAHLQAPAVHPPDAVLLGDHAAGDQAARRQFLSNPVRVEASKPATAATTISQYLVAVRPRAGRQARGAARPDPRRRPTSRTPSSSATASATSPRCSARSPSTASTPARCTATWTSARARRRSTVSARTS